MCTCMCVHIYIYMSIHVYVYTPTGIHEQINTHAHTTHTYMCTLVSCTKSICSFLYVHLMLLVSGQHVGVLILGSLWRWALISNYGVSYGSAKFLSCQAYFAGAPPHVHLVTNGGCDLSPSFIFRLRSKTLRRWICDRCRQRG